MQCSFFSLRFHRAGSRPDRRAITRYVHNSPIAAALSIKIFRDWRLQLIGKKDTEISFKIEAASKHYFAIILQFHLNLLACLIIYIPSAIMSDIPTIAPLVEKLDSQLDKLEDALEPLLGNLSEMASQLPLLDRAKLYSLTAYAIESLLFCM